MIELGSRRFKLSDQLLFAELSGDTNPLHMDPVAARRSVVGDVVVHGLHTVLWALEKLAESPHRPSGLSALDIRFPKPVYLGEEVRLTAQRLNESDLHITAQVGDKAVASIRLTDTPVTRVRQQVDDGILVPDSTPKDIAFVDMTKQRSIVPYAVPVDRFRDAFPASSLLFGAPLLRDLAACSRLVGMEAPGLRSVFSRLTLAWHQHGSSAPLNYDVTKADARFSLITIAVAGGDFSGTILAFSPQPPPRQLTINELKEMVGPTEFVGQTALIVGGSRGLGELTAKATAAVGGNVCITYAVGRAEAEAVVAEIRRSGGVASCFAYDASRSPEEQLNVIRELQPTHLYYYATCQIFRAKGQAFDSSLLSRFTTFYVDAFHAICRAFWDRGVRGLSCFYPSSIAVEERPKGMTEYAMAKAAGEILAHDLPDIFPGYHSYQIRLPRLLTDQTAIVSEQKLPNAIHIILPVLRKMRSA